MGDFSTLPSHAPLPIRLPALQPVHTDRRFVVSGGARGLGRAVAQLLVEQGASVWLLDILPQVEQTAVEVGARGFGRVDVSSPDELAEAVERAHEGLGGFDGLASVAGVVRHSDPLRIPRSDWEDVFAVNVFGSYHLSQLVATAMIQDGTPGSMVLTSSEAGKIGHVDSLAYSAAEAAVISMTRMLSASLTEHDINVNCVCPGGIPTAMLREVADYYSLLVDEPGEEIFEKLISSRLHRHTALDEVAHVFSYLLSDGANVIRGQAINADGGDVPY